jgi:hypothetical protein
MSEPLTDDELAKIRCWEPDKGFTRNIYGELLPAKERRLREEHLRNSIPGLLATIDSERGRANRAEAEVEKLRECAECTETCNYTERHAYALDAAETERDEYHRTLSLIEGMALDDAREGHFLARLIDIQKMASEALAPDEGCRCLSYYERTGIHAEGCPLARAVLTEPEEP